MTISYAVDINGMDFLDFMKKPNSLTSIISEYYSIVPKQEEEQNSPSAQTVIKSIKEIGMQLVRYLHRCVKLRNKETILDASFVDGYQFKQKYLCIQSLQEDDCDKFWRAVWNHKVQIIVMISRLSEKNYQYWSPREDCVIVSDKFKIKTLKISIKPHYKLTLLTLTDQSGRVQKISHYQYTAWPWDSFTHQPDKFIDFFSNVNDMCRQLARQTADEKIAPIIVQCTEGIGSSAVFCVFDICVAQLDKTGTLSLPSVLKKVRQQNYGFMNHLNDYVLCYQLLGVYVEKKLFALPFI